MTTEATRASLSKEPERIARMFDGIARRYDRLNHLLSAGLDRRWRRHAIRELKLTGRERVLDVCTGTADLAIEAATSRSGRARDVIGVDFSPEMLRLAHRKIQGASLASRIRIARGDATRLPLPDWAVDAATVASASATSSIPFRPAASFIVCWCLAGNSRYSSSVRRRFRASGRCTCGTSSTCCPWLAGRSPGIPTPTVTCRNR